MRTQDAGGSMRMGQQVGRAGLSGLAESWYDVGRRFRSGEYGRRDESRGAAKLTNGRFLECE
jgi:hypothetical protein